MHVAMYSLEQRHPFDESSDETVTALHVTRGQKASLLAAQSRGFVHVLREACPWCQTRPVHVEPRHRTQGHCGGQSSSLSLASRRTSCVVCVCWRCCCCCWWRWWCVVVVRGGGAWCWCVVVVRGGAWVVFGVVSRVYRWLVVGLSYANCVILTLSLFHTHTHPYARTHSVSLSLSRTVCLSVCLSVCL